MRLQNALQQLTHDRILGPGPPVTRTPWNAKQAGFFLDFLARNHTCLLVCGPMEAQGKETLPPVLSECIESYLGDCYGLSPGTRALYAAHLERFLQSVGDRPIDEVEAAVVRRFMAGLRRSNGRPYSAAYVDQVYRTLHTFFEWLVRERILIANPMAHVRRPRVPKRKSPRLTLDEVKRVIEAAKGTVHAARNLAIVCLMLDSGLRRGEVLTLRVKDVDLENGVVRVFGKGGKERDVPIGSMTAEALRAYLAVRPASASPKLFLTMTGRPLSKSGLQSLMYRLKGKAGLPQLHCHLLRHTFANHFISAGGSLRKLQKILGHASIQTTAAIYTDPELSELQEEHARVSPLSQLRRGE